MKQRLMFLILLLSAVFMLQTIVAQEKTNMEEMMKKWQEAMNPNENHKKLDGMVGSWDISSKIWMSGPDQPPAITKGSAEIKWELDGRFLYQEMNGEMMGMPLHGMGYTGFDNIKKRYVMFWIDNSSTAMYTGEGNFDTTGTLLTMEGKADDPVTGERDKTIKYVCILKDKDSWVFEMYDAVMPGKNVKTGEMTYTRRK